ncbi:MAG: TfoX/Sxy family protein [Patescibacteria group bacterium]
MDTSFAEYVADQVGELGEVRIKKIFSSYGLYLGETFFGIVNEGVLYLKTNPETAKKYQAVGMGPFTPSQDQVLKNYLEVPPEIIDDKDQLVAYVEEACGV